MKRIVLTALTLSLAVAVSAADAPDVSTTTPSGPAPAPTAAKPAAADADSLKAEIVVGTTLPVRLACNPGTGYQWELKSLDRAIVAAAGEIEFRQPVSGKIGGGGDCVLTLKGVKPGETKAVLVYRRPWEKGAPAKTFTVRVKVVLPGSRP